MTTLFLAIISAVLIFYSSKATGRFVEPIKELSAGVKEIARGNLDKKLDIHTGDEIEHLADSFNSMTEKLKNHIQHIENATAERERIKTELNVAKDIQVSMLPKLPAFTERKDFDIYATMRAAKEVGGDFYDFYLLDHRHLVITIADVSGKGVPAALFMVIAKTMLKDFTIYMRSPNDFAAVVASANRQLVESNDMLMFVTLFFGMLDLNTGDFTYVNAGHSAPLIYEAARKAYRYLPAGQNFVLGGLPDTTFEQESIKLKPHDIIFLYTDGIIEAMDDIHEQYSSERLNATLNDLGGEMPLPDLLDAVQKSVDDFEGKENQTDDITMLALRFNG